MFSSPKPREKVKSCRYAAAGGGRDIERIDLYIDGDLPRMSLRFLDAFDCLGIDWTLLDGYDSLIDGLLQFLHFNTKFID